ncbi:MAG: hypothetical protein CMJ64_25680 [Planctomycetaceae bacterium]|nr:hypothetical protein [Planctomycetaceae bacterium]
MVETSIRESVIIDRCVACDQSIPALIVGEATSRRSWACSRCGATYLATLAGERRNCGIVCVWSITFPSTFNRFQRFRSLSPELSCDVTGVAL